MNAVIRVHEYTKSAKWAYNMYNLIRGQNRRKKTVIKEELAIQLQSASFFSTYKITITKNVRILQGNSL